MSRRNGPSAVTNGLVFCLDAANYQSYVSGSLIWYDVSGNNTTGSIENGPTFSTNNNGYLVFDSSNDHVNFNVNNLTSTTTVEMWCKIKSGFSERMMFGWNLYDVWCPGSRIGYNTANGDLYGISSATVSSLGIVNNWAHYVFEMRSDVSYTNNRIYINAVSQSLSQQLGGEQGANRNFNSGFGRISSWRANLDYPIPMDLAMFNVYNKALTPSEIRRNFEMHKSRFGL